MQKIGVDEMRIPSVSPLSLRRLLSLLFSNQCPNAISDTDNEEAAERDGHDHHKLYLLLLHIRRGIHHLGKQDHEDESVDHRSVTDRYKRQHQGSLLSDDH